MTLEIRLPDASGNTNIPRQPRIITNGLVGAFSLHPELINRRDLFGNKGQLKQKGTPIATAHGMLCNEDNTFISDQQQSLSQTVIAIGRADQRNSPATSNPFLASASGDGNAGANLYVVENSAAGTSQPKTGIYLTAASDGNHTEDGIVPPESRAYSARDLFYWIALAIDAAAPDMRAYFPTVHPGDVQDYGTISQWNMPARLLTSGGLPTYWQFGSYTIPDYGEVVDMKIWNRALTDAEVRQQLVNDRSLYASLAAPITSF